jgi:hypothetical protein
MTVMEMTVAETTVKETTVKETIDVGRSVEIVIPQPDATGKIHLR